MALKDYLNKEYLHDDLGRVEVVSVAPNSRTKVAVKCLDRGEGWCEKTQSYIGVTEKYINHRGETCTSWYKGKNKQYGFVDTVHIKTLKPCQEK